MPETDQTLNSFTLKAFVVLNRQIGWKVNLMLPFITVIFANGNYLRQLLNENYFYLGLKPYKKKPVEISEVAAQSPSQQSFLRTKIIQHFWIHK